MMGLSRNNKNINIKISHEFLDCEQDIGHSYLYCVTTVPKRHGKYKTEYPSGFEIQLKHSG